MELKKREGLGKKIAIGVSLINLANMVGPVGVPVADTSVPGGHVCADNDLHGTSVNLPGEMGGYVQNFFCPRAAYAAEEYIERVPETSGGTQEVTAGDGDTQTIGTLCSGGMQVVNSGGTGIVSTIVHEARVIEINGKQVVNSGGTGTVIDLYSGEQRISAGGTGTVITNKGGDQRVYSGGTGTVITADNGSQDILAGGTGTVITNNGGLQVVSGGTGTVITMNGRRESYGEQFVYGGTGIVSTNNGGYQTIFAGGTGTVEIMDGGTQTLFGSCSGSVKTMNGGMQNVSNYCSGNVETMNGGMVKVQAFSNVDVKTMNDGYVYIAGGTCNVTTVNGGSVELFYGETNIAHFVSGTMSCYQAVTNIGDVYPGVVFILDHNTSNFTQNSGTQTIHSGATVKSFELTGNAASGGTQLVLNGGMAEGTVVREYGSLIVEAGGRTSGTVLAGGTETIMSGGISDVTNMSGGEMNVSAGGTANIGYYAGGTWSVEEGAITNVSEVAPGAFLDGGTQNSGTQKVDSGARTDNFVFVNGAAQEVLAGGTSKNTTVSAESTIIENSGAEIENLTINGGTWQINSGVTKTDEEIKTYTLDVRSGATAENITVSESGAIVENPGAVITIRSINNGGTWRIGSGVTKENQAVSGYTLEIMSGAVADGGTVAADGQITVNSGGTATQTVVNGGRQTINNGGMASETTLDSGSITVNSGGKAIKTAVNNGELFVAAGGEATETKMQGGTISVDDNAYVQIDEATAGYLRLLYTGDAMAKFGNSSVSNHSYTVDRLFATGDKVVLGHGNGSGYSINNTLNVGTMEGYADFVINTDLANNKSDKINIAATTGAAGKNGVIVNYDPSAESAPGTTIESSSPTGTIFATTDSAAAFEGKESKIDVGGNTYEYTPEVTGTPNGSRIDWAITALRYGTPSSSQLIKNGLGNRAYMLGRWRDSNADILRRLNEVRRGEESGIWVAITRGNQKAQGGSYGVKGTYTTLNLGFDRAVDNGWTVGGAISHSMGSEGYEKGSGESKLTTLSAYAMWQAESGQFAEFTARAGKLGSDFFSTGNSGTIKADGINSYGQSLSAGYGIRLNRENGWVFEPKAEFTWAHLNSAGYNTNEGTSAWADGANSAMASLGLHIGKFVGSKGYVYLDTKLVHDFAGGVGVDMYKGRWARLSDNIRGTWLDTQLGYSCKAGAWDIFVEAGLRAGGSAIRRDWQYKAGASFSF